MHSMKVTQNDNISSRENKKALSPFYHKNIFDTLWVSNIHFLAKIFLW